LPFGNINLKDVMNVEAVNYTVRFVRPLPCLRGVHTNSHEAQ